MIYTIYEPDGTNSEHEVDLPARPGYDRLKAVLSPLFPGTHFEHVTILRGPDMFVDEIGAIRGLPVNEAATKLYQEAAIRRGFDARDLSKIYGRAVVFHQRVWY